VCALCTPKNKEKEKPRRDCRYSTIKANEKVKKELAHADLAQQSLINKSSAYSLQKAR